MKKILVLLVPGVLITTCLFAQVYNDKYEAMTSPMDRVEAQHKAMTATVPEPGAIEDATPQDVRYLKMTQRMDTAADFSLNAEYRTIEDAYSQSEKSK